nr:SDR family NAD(P)-dependent oxidoreductase [Pseudenhygromyxa sp. WMMC2535]
MVTGASSGLGAAITAGLARRGAQVYGAARTATPEVTSQLRAAAGCDRVDMLPVDLAELDRIEALADALAERLAATGAHLNLVVCNAGSVPLGDRQTSLGLEHMFVVNYLAKVVLIDALRRRGLLGPLGERAPRVIIVASEAHRGAAAVDLDQLGAHTPFGVGEVIARYASYKLALLTYAMELSRRLEGEGVAVHALCPGAVDSKLARAAPRWSKPLLGLIFRLFFQPPEKAAQPVLYLALAPELEGETGIYLHQWARKQPDPRAREPEHGAALWRATEALLDRVHPCSNRTTCE